MERNYIFNDLLELINRTLTAFGNMYVYTVRNIGPLPSCFKQEIKYPAVASRLTSIQMYTGQLQQELLGSLYSGY